MYTTQSYIDINLAEQRLILLENGKAVFDATISSARNGAGEQQGSECTPRGWHVIRAAIGHGCAENAVFVGRRPSGEHYSEELAQQYPERDWVLCRILWLSGLERGYNRGGQVDSQRRYIYIHGTPDSEPMGVPLSHGCIRMRNHELHQLFDRVTPGTRVLIRER